MTTQTVGYLKGESCHVLARRVPPDIWAHVRRNAKLSNLTFNDYLIRLYAQSQPLPPSEPSHPTTAKVTLSTNPDNPTEESVVPSTKQP